MMKLLLSLVLVLTLLVSPLFAGDSPPLFIHSAGYGPVTIGMTVKQAAAALGVPLQRSEATREPAGKCFYVSPRGDDTVIGFMVRGGVITRIDVWAAAITTASGLTVGASEAAILKEFAGRVAVDEHEYLGAGGHYLTVDVAGGNQFRFDTAAQKTTPLPDGTWQSEDFRVTTFRVGRPSSVSLVEGCF